MALKDWRVNIYNLGSTDTSTSKIDFTIGSTVRPGVSKAGDLAAPVTVHSPTVLALTGQTESQPWAVSVLDVGSGMTAHLADTSGRVDLLGRLLTVDRNLDGAGFVRQGAGRITDVMLGQDVASYDITVQDERALERQATVFSTNTTRIYPAGPHQDYGPFPARIAGDTQARVVARPSTTIATILLGNQFPRLTNNAVQAIRDDVKPDAVDRGNTPSVGNFTYLRFNAVPTLGSTRHDFPVYRFKAPATPGIDFGREPFTAGLDAHVQTGANLRFDVIATSSELSTLTPIGFTFGAFLHAMSGPPSEAWPLHLGAQSFTTAGIHPVDLLEDIWQGQYSSAGTLLPRYSTAALDTLRQGSYPQVRFRITHPTNMARWLEDHIYGPFGIAPFLGSSGALSPKSVRLPESTGVISFIHTKANVASPPTWHHASRELVTKLRFHYTLEAERQSVLILDGPPVEAVGEFGGDGIASAPKVVEETHDRVHRIGTVTHDVQLTGLHTVQLDLGRFGPFAEQPSQTEVPDNVAFMKQEIFNRFGDGPIIGSFTALSTAESVTVGDWTKITLGTFPNPQTGARTGTRVVQIIGKRETPEGPEFQYLDGGPSAAPLTAPTISLAKSTDDPKHELIATVGTVPAGGSFQLQIAPSSTLPASTSQLWQPAYTASQTSSAAYGLPLRASGNTYFGRVRGTKVGRISSTWSVSTGAALDTISAPTAIGVGTITAFRAVATWTVGDSDYPVQVCVDDTHTAALGSSNAVTMLPAGSNRYTFVGLTSASTHIAGVRHIDDWGGASAFDSTTFETSTTPAVAPKMLGISILQGGST